MVFLIQDSDEVFFEINVILLVDVMLVLLVVFIVIVLLLINLILINLLKIELVVLLEQKDFLVVSIDGVGKLFVNKDEIQLELLESNLVVVKVKDVEVCVQLQVDEGVNYGQVVKVMVFIECVGIIRLVVIIVC